MNSSLFPYLPIKTQRTTLEVISETDIENLYTNFTSAITRYLYLQPFDSIDDARQFVEKSIVNNQNNKDLQLTIKLKTGEYVGNIGIHNLHSTDPRISIWIIPDFQNQGYGKEVLMAIKDFAEEHLDYEYLGYPCDKGNYQSIKMAELLGGIKGPEYSLENKTKTRMLNVVEYRIYKNSTIVPE